jgi:hypothetical protein
METIEPKNKGGRPPAVGVKRDSVIQIAFTEKEKTELTQMSRLFEMSIAMMARRALQEWISRECEAAGIDCPISFRPNKRGPNREAKAELNKLSLTDRNNLRIEYLTSSVTGVKPEALAQKYKVSVAAVFACKEPS